MSDPNDDKTIVLGGAAASPAPPPPPRIASANALPVGTRLFEFEIVGLVGEGGFGIVYLADDHSLQRRVAIKEYMPSSLATRGTDASVVVRSERHTDTFEIGRRSFVNEARLLAQFDHPALLKVYRFWEANGTAYMAMPYYAGKTLRDVLRERQGPPPDESWIRKILGPVMDALDLMHAEHCYHRDVAPDNIMLLRDDRPVLLDFGAARRVISDMTQALTVILKPGYAPIEQYAEMPGVKQGPWTDIYALAAVVYFTIAGRTPPPAVGRMLQDAYEPLATLAAGRYSDQFLQGIDQCLRVKGEDRPQSITQMRDLLGMGDYVPAPAATASPSMSEPRPSGGEQRQATVIHSEIPATTDSSRLAPAPARAPEPRPAAAPAAQPLTPAKRPGAVVYLAAVAAAGALAVGVFVYTREPAAPTTASAPPAPPSPPSAAPSTPPPVARIAPPPAAPAPTLPIPLGDAFAATVAASDARFGLHVEKVKSPLTIGRDALSFVLRSQRNGLLYVLLWDKATGQLSEIFPNSLDRNNKVTAGKPLPFPRPDWAYEADQPKGNWEVITIVADSPRDFSALRFQSRAGATSAQQKVVEAALGESGQGAAALGGEARCDSGKDCSPAYAAVSFAVEEVTPAERKEKEVAKAPAPREKPPARDGGGSQQAEKQYVKDLNKSLDKLLNER